MAKAFYYMNKNDKAEEKIIKSIKELLDGNSPKKNLADAYIVEASIIVKSNFDNIDKAISKCK